MHVNVAYVNHSVLFVNSQFIDLLRMFAHNFHSCGALFHRIVHFVMTLHVCMFSTIHIFSGPIIISENKYEEWPCILSQISQFLISVVLVIISTLRPLFIPIILANYLQAVVFWGIGQGGGGGGGNGCNGWGPASRGQPYSLWWVSGGKGLVTKSSQALPCTANVTFFLYNCWGLRDAPCPPPPRH